MNIIDFSLQNVNADHPSVLSAAYVLIMAFCLSSTLALVYHLTTPNRSGLGQFIQTMVLGSIGAAIIVLAIGDSVGRGLGILGALAIIRFRTTLKQQRDIVFIFCALGVGMACGMYGFNIAVIGTLVLSALAILFRFTTLNGLPVLKQQLKITLPLSSSLNDKDIEQLFKQHKIEFELLRNEFMNDSKSDLHELTYTLKNRAVEHSFLIEQLKKMDPAMSVRLWIRKENEND